MYDKRVGTMLAMISHLEIRWRKYEGDSCICPGYVLYITYLF